MRLWRRRKRGCGGEVKKEVRWRRQGSLQRQGEGEVKQGGEFRLYRLHRQCTASKHTVCRYNIGLYHPPPSPSSPSGFHDRAMTAPVCP